MTDKELSHAIIGVAIEIHRSLGPGLLEAVYEECFAQEFTLRNIPFERHFLVNRRIVAEIKSIEAILPVHESVMLTYLRLSGTSLGLLINFNVPTRKDGIRR